MEISRWLISADTEFLSFFQSHHQEKKMCNSGGAVIFFSSVQGLISSKESLSISALISSECVMQILNQGRIKDQGKVSIFERKVV